jgi:Holliday junction DNA helicase RuvA
MIAHLSGTLREKQATSVILDVGGVGYEVTIPVTTFFGLEDAGSQVDLRIYTHVREDSLQLFGFRTARERELFTLLISVSGIGPKSAIAMLSGMSADEIISAIHSNNLVRLTSIPGVGRKTAERLVIELRDKVVALSVSPEADRAASDATSRVPSDDSLREDTLSALLNLGYHRALADRALTKASGEGGVLSVELLLRRSLRHLSKG